MKEMLKVTHNETSRCFSHNMGITESHDNKDHEEKQQGQILVKQ